ncbi:MAG: hypothetical protein CAF43_013820 [Nitrospira sp. CG24C]|nr:MAG: hypothetical protein CAF43_013820 [Nitrospira sp. CG24C]
MGIQGELDSQKSPVKEQFAQDTSGWVVWEASVSGWDGRLIVLLLVEQKKKWSLMIFYARATRGLRRGRRGNWHGLCARRAPTIKQWSLDARSGVALTALPMG